MSLLILTAALVTVAIGAGILWANPGRFTNQAFAFASLIAACWLVCVLTAMQAGLSIEIAIRAGLSSEIISSYKPIPWVPP